MAESKPIVEVDYRSVITIVIKTISELDQGLDDFLSIIRKTDSTSNGQSKYFVGLDIERQYYQVGSQHQIAEKVAVLKLCFDDSCLIIQLLHISEPVCSLFQFFQRQELTFVGVKIQHCLDALNRDYGIKCRNYFDLGETAALHLKDERYTAYGLRALADELKYRWDPENLPDSPLGGWGASTLSERHIEGATCDAYLCYLLASYYLPRH